MAMATEWFVKTDQGAAGPFSSNQMVEFAQAGKIRPATLVRKGVDGPWRPAEQLRGLLAQTPARSPAEPGAAASSNHFDPTWVIAAAIVSGGLLVSACVLVLGLRPSAAPVTTVARKPEIISAPLGGVPMPGQQPEAASIGPGEANASSAVAPTSDASFDKAGEAIASESLRPAGSEASAQPNATVQPPTVAAPTPRSFADVIADVEASVALIKGSRGSGTGFTIKPGVVVTNKHVIRLECVEDIRLRFPSATGEFKTPQPVSLIFKDNKRDLAYLRVNDTPPPLPIVRDYTFTRGQEVTVVGNPGTIDGNPLLNAVSRGVVSTETMIEGQPYYQLGISINPGNSGGPVLDSDGNVMGVVTLKDRKREGMGFCIPPQDLVDSLALMEAVREEDLQTINDNHDFQAIVFELSIQGIIAKRQMNELISAMSRAIDAGGTADHGLQAVRQQKELSLVTPDQSRALQASVARLAKNPCYSEATRQRLADLWTTVRAMISYAESPRGSLNSYRDKARDLADQFEKETETLRVLVGSPFEE